MFAEQDRAGAEETEVSCAEGSDAEESENGAVEEAVQVFVWGDGVEDPEDESSGLVKGVWLLLSALGWKCVNME